MGDLRLYAGAAAAILGYIIYHHHHHHHHGQTKDNNNNNSKIKKLPLPPGPKPWPLLGNITDFPPPDAPEHLHWLKHKDLYGPISSVTAGGTTLVLLHDRAMAREMLDKTHAVRTSNRPEMVMANKLCGYGSIVPSLQYDSRSFTLSRRLLHQELGTRTSAAQFRHVQEAEVARQLVRVLDIPGKLIEHYRTTSAAGILRMAYGYEIGQPSSSSSSSSFSSSSSEPDVLVSLINQMVENFSLAANPMAWAVDMVPALQYLPFVEWIPGVEFKKKAREWRRVVEAAAQIPYEFVLSGMADGTGRECYVSKLVRQLGRRRRRPNHHHHDRHRQVGGDEEEAELKHGDDNDDDGDTNSLEPRLRPDEHEEHAIKWTATSLYGAAADTIVITLRAFTLAMLKFPQVQRRAQEEIDRVVIDRHGRLPGFQDRENLPYVDALVKEAARWWPVTPMGFPHVATEDFALAAGGGGGNGGDGGGRSCYYRIPRGAMIVPAVWWFMHDPDVYRDPDVFDPSRFLAPRCEPDPVEVWGFGRRACPGRFFADASLYLNIVQTLAAFRLRRAVVIVDDGQRGGGKKAEEAGLEDVKMRPGVMAYPTEFDVRVEPRGERYVEMVRQLGARYPLEPSDAAKLQNPDQFGVES